MLARRRGSPRGQTLVEFAIIIPIFILVLMGIFDLGRAVYAWSTVNNAAREAGRQAIVDQTLAHIQNRAIQHAASLGLGVGNVTVHYNDPSTPNTAGSCNGNDTPAFGCLADVTVRYTFTAATPVISRIVPAFTLQGETKFPVAALCQEPTQTQCPPGS